MVMNYIRHGYYHQSSEEKAAEEVLEPNICSSNMIKTMHGRMVKVPLNATILVSLFIHPFPSHTLLFTSQGQAITWAFKSIWMKNPGNEQT